MNVLSLFDGMSCGRIALERAGVTVGNYYASEIDRYAMAITKYNYPDTHFMGDVRKWREWNIDWASIGLISSGFPCQAWSVAGQQLGDRDPRGMLFWDMLDIISHVKSFNPNVKILIENVKMKKEFHEYVYENIKSVVPETTQILINSSLVSAQSRNRYYWTDIPNVTQPKDRNIDPMDILEYKGTVLNYSSSGRGKGKVEGRFTKAEKALTLTATGYTNRAATVIVGRVTGFAPHRVFKKTLKLPCLTATMYKGIQAAGRPVVTWSDCLDKNIREIDKGNYRMPTPMECERMQTLSDLYTQYGDFDGVVKEISNSQRYKCLGNGWTVDVIAHILKGLHHKEEYDLL